MKNIFEKIKQPIVDARALALYGDLKAATIQDDAFKQGIDAVLLQDGKDNNLCI